MALIYAATSSFVMAAHGRACAGHMMAGAAAASEMQVSMAVRHEHHDAHAPHDHGAMDTAPAAPVHSDCGETICLCAAAGCGLAGVYVPNAVTLTLFSASGQYPLGDYAARGQDIDIPYPPPRRLV